MQSRTSLSVFCTVLCLAVILSCTLRIQSQPLPNSPVSGKAVQPVSILSENTLFTVYGLAFDLAPKLGRLGAYSGFDDMEKSIRPWLRNISKRHDKKGVIPAVHLIYAMANYPCKPDDDCLLYLEGKIKDLAAAYIEPAAKRGWMVVLDTQIAKSDPVEQVKRMIDKGYLKYDNVIVALDPEFHVYPGEERPGRPIGKIKASQINEVQRMLDRYVTEQKLASKKILMVYQFGDPNVNDGVPFMIEDKKDLKTFDNVELVIIMDGLGKQAIKVTKYNKITDSKVYPFIKFRGIKVFFPNRWEKGGHYDRPPLSPDQIFGIKPAQKGPKMQSQPDVLIIA
jgi:hypothetical protein